MIPCDDCQAGLVDAGARLPQHHCETSDAQEHEDGLEDT
jgi:hypothetical protein